MVEIDYWISIDEILPSDEKKKFGRQILMVIQTNFTSGHSYRTIKSGVFKDGEFRMDYWSAPVNSHKYSKVTHWMYMPELPKKKTKKLNRITGI
jgi:MOSC domain-containing protein YiiM